MKILKLKISLICWLILSEAILFSVAITQPPFSLEEHAYRPRGTISSLRESVDRRLLTELASTETSTATKVHNAQSAATMTMISYIFFISFLSTLLCISYIGCVDV